LHLLVDQGDVFARHGLRDSTRTEVVELRRRTDPDADTAFVAAVKVVANTRIRHHLFEQVELHSPRHVGVAGDVDDLDVRVGSEELGGGIGHQRA